MTTTFKIKFVPSDVTGREGNIYFQVIHRRIVRSISTQLKVMPSEWDTASHNIKVEGNRKEYLIGLRQQLFWCVQRLKRVIAMLNEDCSEYTADDVIEMYRRCTAGNSLYNFTMQIICEKKSMGRLRTSETYLSALRSFMLFRTNVDVPLDGIDSQMMLQYEAFLMTKGRAKNTISFYMRILRAIYNRAVEKRLTDQKYPFRHVYTGIDKTVKRALPFKSIKRLRELDLSWNPSLQYTRDLFLFSFYTRGMSFIDMAFLKKANVSGGMLRYVRKKTGQTICVKWEKCMQEIVDRYAMDDCKYLLPVVTEENDERKQYVNAMRLANYHLKELAKMIGIEKLSMYVARHSWASAAKSQGVPLPVISEAMGHNSETTTRIYLSSLENSVIDNANKMIIDKLFV